MKLWIITEIFRNLICEKKKKLKGGKSIKLY